MVYVGVMLSANRWAVVVRCGAYPAGSLGSPVLAVPWLSLFLKDPFFLDAAPAAGGAASSTAADPAAQMAKVKSRSWGIEFWGMALKEPRAAK